MNFNDFCWHDAIIEAVYINRLNPGKDDRIEFKIKWPENQGEATLFFEEVYWAMMDLNFGIVAEETILDATTMNNNNDDLVRFYSKWNGAMDDVKLETYQINLNSSGGKIRIISKKFRIEKR